jgi:hypothetical protein
MTVAATARDLFALGEATWREAASAVRRPCRLIKDYFIG